VDAFVATVTHELDRLRSRVKEVEAEAGELRAAVPRGGADVVAQSLSILTSAQQAADTAVASADEYSGRVIAEARQAYNHASQRAQEIMDEAAGGRTRPATQSELDKRTVYLAALHDSVKVQLTSTLEAILDHVTSEYQKATRISDEVARARQTDTA
jgi:hypothetical protein